MFDSCSGASFGERKWLTALGCKIVKADTTLHFHGFCDPDGQANVTDLLADVCLTTGGYSNVYRVWVVEGAPTMCLIGRDNMTTSTGFGTTLRPCTEDPTVTFDGHPPVHAHVDPTAAKPTTSATFLTTSATTLSTSEGISIPGSTIGTEFIRTPTSLPPNTDVFVGASRHGMLRVEDQVTTVRPDGYIAVLVHNSGQHVLDLPPGSAIAHAQPITTAPLHPATTAALSHTQDGDPTPTAPGTDPGRGPNDRPAPTSTAHTLYTEQKPASMDNLRGAAWRGRGHESHEEAVASFSDNLPSQSDLDDVLVGMVDQAQIGDTRQHARMLKMLRRHAKAGLWSTKENKTGFIKGSAESFKFKSDRPIWVPQYPMNDIQAKEVIRQVKAMEAEGLVHPTKSAANFPLLLVDKGDRKAPRVCLDLRRLNAEIIQQHFAIPRINTLVDDMARSSIFSTMDCTAGYSMVRLATDDGPFPTSERIAFTLPHGQGRYAMSVLTMGISPAMFSFQSQMHRLLHTHTAAGYCANYVDDCVVHNGTKAECHETSLHAQVDKHIDHLDAVFTSLADAGVKLGAHKTLVLQRSIEALGCHVEDHTVSISTEKKKAIDALATPSTRKELEHALGVLGISRRYQPNYAQTAACLHELLQTDHRKFKWEPHHSVAFEALKERLATTPPLAATNWERPFEIHADASNYACGAALMQRCPVSGVPTVLEWFSAKFTPPEMKYSTGEREALALVKACKQWRTFLMANSKFTVLLHTDHKPLVYCARSADTNSRLWRWLNELDQYQFDIKYVSGKSNTLPDALSRVVSATVNMMAATNTTTTTHPPVVQTWPVTTNPIHTIDHLVARLYHHNTAKALWFRVRWQGHPPSSDTVERGTTLRQDVGGRTMRSLRAELDANPTATANADLPLPPGFSGFTATPTPPKNKQGTKKAATTHTHTPTTSITAPPSHNTRDTARNNSLDATAAADHPPTDPTIKFTPQTLPTAHLLPNLTAADVAKAQRADPRLRGIWDDTKTPAAQRLHPEYNIHNGLLTRTYTPTRGPRRGHIIAAIALPPSLVKLALVATHDAAGHHGQTATLFAMRTRFDFPKLHTRTIKYIAGCKRCGRGKRDLRPVPTGKIPVVQGFGDTLSIDFAGPLPESANGMRHLCIIVCHATKWVHVVPTKTTTAADASSALLDFVYHNTVPRKIVSDRGSSFCNRAWHGLMTALNIQHRPTVSYNPQGDAHAESQVKSCKALIKMAIQRHPRHWCEAARWAAWSYNSSYNDITGSTPYFCKHGREPTTPTDIIFNTPEASNSLTLSQLVARINDVHSTTQDNINAMHDRTERRNAKLNRTRSFSDGDTVWLHRVYPGKRAPSAGGLHRSFFFPFRPDQYTIIDNKSTQHVRIRNNRDSKEQIVHTRRLKPCRPQEEAYDPSDFFPQTTPALE